VFFATSTFSVGSGYLRGVTPTCGSIPAAARSCASQRGASIVAATLVLFSASFASGAGPPALVHAGSGVSPATMRRIRDEVALRRSVREPVPLPPSDARSAERVASEQRAAAVRLALERAVERESAAAFEDCVREAAGAMSDAIDIIAATGDAALLRDLHLQIGACMSLGKSAANARLHFLEAALLDESPPRTGKHREEAESAQAAARADILARSRGRVRIETDPPGAEVWIDGHRATGVTPLDADVRLGDHFVTVRRFRFEPHTERRVLQPTGRVKLVMMPATRATLHDQLAATTVPGAQLPSEREMLLATAAWSRAEQIAEIAPVLAGRRALRVSLLDAVTGRVIRGATLTDIDDSAEIRRAVCAALGEACEPPSRGVPWQVWPVVVGVVAAAAIVVGVVLANDGRDSVFCPAGGCR
jgi:hypothetical protein